MSSESFSMKLDDPESVERLAPTAAAFRPQLRGARISIFVFATVFLICGIGIVLQAEPPLLERKHWAGIGMAGLAFLIQISALLIPTRWIMWWSVDDAKIACIHANECRTGRGLYYWIREFGIAYLIIIPIAYVGIWLCEKGHWVWGTLVLVPTLTIGVARIWYLGNKDSIKFFAGLEALLNAKGYDEGQSFPPSQLASTFLKQDNFFKVEKSWMKRGSATNVHWCKYVASGSSMTSGVACVAELPVTMPRLATLLTTMSSVYYDHASDSIFGTFRASDETRHSQLAGLPWQFKHYHLYARLDEDILSYVFKNEPFDESFLEEIIDSWELFTEEIRTLALTEA